MSETKLLKKLRLSSGARAAVINAPEGYLEHIQPLPSGVILSETLEGSYDWVQIFAENRAALEGVVAQIMPALKPESLLWISFPKGSSKMQTDLTRDQGWDSLQELDLKWVNLVSIDESWSAFALRPYRPGEAKQSFR